MGPNCESYTEMKLANALRQNGILCWIRRGLHAASLGYALTIATPLMAGPTVIPGASDPAFETALSLWLDDHEDQALSQMATLAQSGNVAAQMLLGLIDKTPALQGPYLADLAREDRIELLRAEGGLSGRNWLTDGSAPLAQVWTRLWSVEADPTDVAQFQGLGESCAARDAMVALSAREHPALATLPLVEVDPETLYLLWAMADADRQAEILAQMPADHPQRRIVGQDVAPDALMHWLASAPEAAALADLCAQACGTEDQPAYTQCLRTAYHALGSHNALLTLCSPAEALIPQAQFFTSARGHATTLRRILLASDMRLRRQSLQQVAEESTCLGKRLAAENARYHPLMRPPVVPQDE